MKKIFLFMAVLITVYANAQNTFPSTGAAGIGTTKPDSSSLLEIKSLSKGLLIPRMSVGQRDRITLPATGLLIYQTNNLPGFYYYNGTAWTAISVAAGANKALSNLVSPTAVNQSLIPGTTGTLDLGSPALLWKRGYFAGILDADSGLYIQNKRAFLATQDQTYVGISSGTQPYNPSATFTTAVGYNTLSSGNSGTSNTAIGGQAELSNTSGNQNAGVGFAALQNTTSGSQNTAIGGRNAGTANTTGNYNTFIGTDANAATSNLANATAIGAKAYVSADNSLILGSISGVNGATADAKIGIGTSTPGFKLDVNGTANFSSLIKTSGTAPLGQHGSSLWVGGNDNGALFPTGSNELGIRIFNNSIAPGSSTIQGWDYSQNIPRVLAINDGGGNVGIGTSAPVAKLDVAGNIKINDGTQGAGKVLTSDANGLASWATPGATPWSVSGSNIFNNNTGNVGIGVNNPKGKLDVNGNILLRNYGIITNDSVLSGGGGGDMGLYNKSSGQWIRMVTNNAPFRFYTDYANGTTGGFPPNPAALSIEANGNVGIGTAQFAVGAKLEVDGNVKIVDGTQGAGKVLTSDTAGLASWQTPAVSPWTISGNNISNSNSGNVGIGTNAPFTQLANTTTNVIATDGYGVSTRSLLWQSSGVGYAAAFYNPLSSVSGGGVIVKIHGNTGTVLDLSASDSVSVMSIKGNGNVGIGIANPTRPLVVRSRSTTANAEVSELASAIGDTTFHLIATKGATTNASGDAMLKFGMVYGNVGSSLKSAMIRFHRGGSGNDGAISFSTNNDATEIMRLTSAGRVGIGTTIPNGQFELSLDQGRKPSTSTWTITSDARLKNIDGAYTKGLKEILQLKPIVYHYKNANDRKFDAKTLAAQAVGFTAQDVQKVFPECVSKDEDGYLNLNIHAILIAQVNAIQQLSAQNDDLRSTVDKQQQQINGILQKINDLQTAQLACCNSTSLTQSNNQNAILSSIAVASLKQNVPNPFSSTTVISYTLPQHTNNAAIIITDIKGNTIKNVTVTASGSVTVAAGSLTSGTYKYSLIVDGKLIDTKTMVMTK